MRQLRYGMVGGGRDPNVRIARRAIDPRQRLASGDMIAPAYLDSGDDAVDRGDKASRLVLAVDPPDGRGDVSRRCRQKP